MAAVVVAAGEHMSLSLEHKTRVIHLIDVCYKLRSTHLVRFGSSCKMEFAKRDSYGNCKLARADNCSFAVATILSLAWLPCNDIPSLANRIAGMKWFESMAMSSLARL